MTSKASLAARSIRSSVNRFKLVFLSGIALPDGVEAFATATIKPQFGGLVTNLHFQEGRDLGAGDLLFTLDSKPVQAELRPSVGHGHLVEGRASGTRYVDGIG